MRHTLRVMPIFNRRLTPLALLAAACSAGAAPDRPVDELTAFLSERGLVQRAGEAALTASQTAAALVVHAMGFIGTPYRLGGNRVETGFDCSGFVRAVFEQTLGLSLPRRADQQAAALPPIAQDELQPGDLVFFNTLRRAYSHVGIYVGDGRFVHSPRPGAEVRVENMRISYWSRRFDGARRAPTLGAASAADALRLPSSTWTPPSPWAASD